MPDTFRVLTAIGLEEFPERPADDFLGLSALAWGLLGGALCSTVVTAILTAIVGMAGSWLLSIFSLNMLMTVGLEAVPAIGAGYASWRVFCRNDLAREPSPPRFMPMLHRALPDQWRVFVWLVLRQGRWVLVGGVAGAVLLGAGGGSGSGDDGGGICGIVVDPSD